MSYSKVILLGRLGADPEVRFTASGLAVANFRIAVDDGYGDKKRTDWHRCVAWKKTAETLGQHATKGSQVLVEGRLQNREWQDKDGQKRQTTEVVVDRFTFSGSKRDTGRSGDTDTGGGSYGSLDDAGVSGDDGGIPF